MIGVNILNCLKKIDTLYRTYLKYLHTSLGGGKGEEEERKKERKKERGIGIVTYQI